MKALISIRIGLLACHAYITILLGLGVAAALNAAISTPPGIDPTLRDELLQRYVDDKGLVNYQAWKESTVDLEALDTSLSQYAPQSSDPAHGEEADAALINAYNAFTIQWILQNYPTTSIKTLKNSWTERRHTIGGHSIFPRRNRAP